MDMNQFMDVFMEEAEEQIQIMEESILRLEQGIEEHETIQILFRAAHTLKGSSAAMGFVGIKEITHEMESLLDLLRNNKLGLTPELIELLMECADMIKALVDAVATDSGGMDISKLAGKIIRYREGGSNVTVSIVESLLEQQSPSPLMLNLDERYRCLEGKEQGHGIFDILVGLDKGCLMKVARSTIIHRHVADLGEIVCMNPPMDEHSDEQDDSRFNALQLVLITQRTESEIQEALSSLVDVTYIHVQDVELNPSVQASKGSEPKIIETHEVSPVLSRASQPEQSQDRKKVRSIRVEVEKLEQLMNLVGELLIDQVGIKQTSRDMERRYQADDNFGKLTGQSDHLGRVIHELQEQVMKIRMLPVEQLFSRLPRIVRDLSKQLGKEIHLQLIGGETEIDRTVIEEISDPLIHLLRNGVDHGIESEEERIRCGKSPEGTLTVHASHEGNQVVIRVKDDGGGIDPERIKKSAIKKGIITDEAAAYLSDREAVRLIFRPGFSTAESVSDISGRGVGMDIVRDHIEKLNGIIDIQSDIGEGTEFHIRLPLTLAIIPGLQVKVNGTGFILPMSNVLEIIRVRPEEVDSIRGEPVINLRGEVLPLLHMQEVLGWDKHQIEKPYRPIVIIGMAEKRIALMVDELSGNADIVVKSVGRYVGKSRCITGATILGDGKVALIFDIGSLF
ncbi:chemotaxis protein CheW [Paenibacillus sp. sgz500958]|uniref:chemotaxis protein CheW n=1 Tax=Paenibacillus sp. sgz500958 TaxID=3242475 RepID=UPI0036D3AABC